jgi:hypothetical protein
MEPDRLYDVTSGDFHLPRFARGPILLRSYATLSLGRDANAPPARRRCDVIRRARILIFVAVALAFISIAVLLIYLLATGSRGAEVATDLGLAIALYGVAARIVGPLVKRLSGTEVDARQLAKLAAVLAVVLAVVIATSVLTVVLRKRYADAEVDLDAPRMIRTGQRVDFGAEPTQLPWRGELVFRTVLDGSSEVSDCLSPAVVTFAVRADGQPLPDASGRNGDEVRIRIPSGTRRVELSAIVLGVGDRDCALRLTLARPKLSRP